MIQGLVRARVAGAVMVRPSRTAPAAAEGTASVPPVERSARPVALERIMDVGGRNGRTDDARMLDEVVERYGPGDSLDVHRGDRTGAFAIRFHDRVQLFLGQALASR